MRNGVQLITYADRFGGGDLPTIREVLTGPLAGVFTGAHILSCYTPHDGANAGFDPIDDTTLDPRLGNWESIRRLSTTHDVTADLIINHISIGPLFTQAHIDFAERRFVLRHASAGIRGTISSRDGF